MSWLWIRCWQIRKASICSGPGTLAVDPMPADLEGVDLLRSWYPGCGSDAGRSGRRRSAPGLVPWLWIRCRQIRKASICSGPGTLAVDPVPADPEGVDLLWAWYPGCGSSAKGSNHFRFAPVKNFFKLFPPIVDRGNFCLVVKVAKKVLTNCFGWSYDRAMTRVHKSTQNKLKIILNNSKGGSIT